MHAIENRWRAALARAVLGGEGPPAEFWARFDEEAPASVRAAMRAATLGFGALPWVLHRRSLGRLGDAEREAMIARVAAHPLGAELLEVVKIMACLGRYDGPPP